eukprot:TRINITY_DN2895_c0_g3_i1.p1 TRINITY_DN2895_c0_g3~~TRINITY_DN2895_c0_g3_i1.p1  ORF type:complete len:240 (+),score=116.46 TRINITY_DN2895_c0_g3_i1:57-776(+)
MAEEEPLLSEYPREELVSALLDAARYGDDDDKALVKQLVEFDPTLVNEADAQGRNAVHMSCANGHEDVLKTLLACKPDVTKVNAEGSSPLHFAAAKGSEACVKILLLAGYPPAAKNKLGRKPLDECWEKEPRDVFQKVEDLLLVKDPDIDEALKEHEAKIEAGDLDGMDPPPGQAPSSSSSSSSTSKPKKAHAKPTPKAGGGYSSSSKKPSPKLAPAPASSKPEEPAKPVEQVSMMMME